jgi:hypothetical protein
LRTASIGVLPPPEPLLEPFELGDFAFAFDFAPDDFELDDFGFARFVDFAVFVVLGLALLDFAFDFDWLFAGALFDCAAFDWVRGFDFDCDFDFVDEPALFGDVRFLDLVSAIFLSPRGSPYYVRYPIQWLQITLNAAESA